MRRSLQNKINILGALFVAFFLLMLPMFTQVKADTRDSLKEARKALLTRWANDIYKEFKPPKNIEDVEVEDADYWAQQAKKNDPQCGEACDVNSDRDGDGISNGEEYKMGRNPSCNEEQNGTDYCRNQDKFGVPEPEPRRLLLERFVNETIPCQATFFQTTCDRPFAVKHEYQQIQLFLNVTNYQGLSWTFQVLPEGSGSPVWTQNGQASPPGPPNSNRDASDIELPPGNYTARVQSTQSTGGVWHFEGLGLR